MQMQTKTSHCDAMKGQYANQMLKVLALAEEMRVVITLYAKTNFVRVDYFEEIFSFIDK